MSEEPKITPSLEDYLEAIYFSFIKNGSARVTDIAADLSCSKPSVNKAINTLKQLGYISHEPYGLVSLTEKGQKTAAQIADRHRILKHFLRDILGVGEDRAETEACTIEHGLSGDTVEKLVEFLDKHEK